MSISERLGAKRRGFGARARFDTSKGRASIGQWQGKHGVETAACTNGDQASSKAHLVAADGKAVFAARYIPWRYPLRRAGRRASTIVAFAGVARLSRDSVIPWDLFAAWVGEVVGEVVGERREIVVAMDWTDFDADNQSGNQE